MPEKPSFFHRATLRKRHFLVLAATLTVMNLAFFSFYFAESARALSTTSRTALAAKTESIDKTLRTRVEQYGLPARYVATNAELQQILTFMQIHESDVRRIGEVIDEVDAISRILRNYSGVAGIADLELYLFSVTEPLLRGIADNVYNLTDIDHQEFYLTITRGKDFSLFRKPYTDMGELDDEYVYIARQVYRLYEPTIPFGGVLLTKVPADHIREILLSNAPTPESITFVVDAEGWVQLASRPELEGTNLYDRFPAVTLREGEIVSFRETFNGEDSLISAIRSVEDWFVVSATPVVEAISALSRLSRILIASLIVTLLFSAFMSYELSATIAGPIVKLVDSIRKVQQGDFSLGIDYHRDDEFAELIGEYNHMLSRIDTLMNDLVLAEQARTRAELTSLQAQINPHFLYNTLDTINWMAIDHNQNDISEIVTQLSDFFRYSVSGGKQYIPLSDELKQVESYLRIQKRQYPDVFDFAIIADEDCADAETTKLVIQPLAENAIVHGFRDIDYRGFIEIAVHREGGVVTIEVADNGTGCDASELNLSLTCRERTSEFFAIQNVNLRIRDRYGEQYGLRYESSRDGLLAVITIPYVPISEENAC